jgi:hypothetical protein
MQALLAALAAIPEFIVVLLTSLAGWLTGGIIGAVWWAWEHWSGTTSWKAVKRGIGAFRDAYIKSQAALKGVQDHLQKEQSKVENMDGQIMGYRTKFRINNVRSTKRSCSWAKHSSKSP